MRFVVTGLAGAIKAIDPRLLNESIGADSVNQRPRAGELSPWREPTTVATVPSGRKSIYRLGRELLSDATYWLSWTTVVHAVRGFLASDPSERTYFTGSGTPKVTDNIIGIATPPYPTAARELGVPAPSGSSTLTETTPGTGSDRLTFYADTFITDQGEESAPRIIGSITAKPGATIAIGSLPAAPAGNYGITVRRIYRSEVGTSGQGEFFFLLDVPSSNVSATDAGLNVGAGVMATTGWEMPPADLKCLIGLWGGMLAGISGRAVRLCEPYKPYAWPLAYEILPPDVTPVALAVWSKNLLMLTTGRPYLVTGSAPASMGDEPVEFEKGCVSVQSVTNAEHGVVWASADGLAYFGNLGPRLLTDGILTREQWLALNPDTLVGVLYEGLYLGSYEASVGVRKGFAIDVREPRGIYFMDQGFSAAHLDKLRDAVYILDGANVRKWDVAASFMTAKFVSKTFRAVRRVSICAVEVIARTWPVTVKIYGDGTLRDTRTITDLKPVTMKGGTPALEWVFELQTAGALIGMAAAPTLAELRQINGAA
jgi:hypothetical protein